MKDALALALVHFLWQGAVLGALGWGLMRLCRSAAVRYTIGVATLAAMLAAPVLTMFILAPAAVEVAEGAQTVGALASGPGTTEVVASATAPAGAPVTSPVLPANWILAVWLVGVCVLSARVAGGWLVARRLITSSVSPVARELEDMAASLAKRLALRRAVRVLASSRAVVPVMVGWWRPVVLIPVSAISGMPLEQIEALLAHEFAHIRRHDYLVNLLQTMVETVCFYHPIVWWMSREVRRERELCCDDLAVAICDRVTYVSALAQVASMATPRLALSAGGGSLRDRIQRLINTSSDTQSAKGGWMAMLPLIFVLSLVAPHSFSSTVTATPTIAPAVAVVPTEAAAETLVFSDPAPQTSTTAESVRRERQAAAEREKMQRAEEAAEALQAAAERQQVELRRRVSEVQADQERNAARAEVVQTEVASRLAELEITSRVRALERMRELATRGLATNDGLAEAQVAVQRAELELVAARAKHELARERANQQEIEVRAEQANAEQRLREEVADRLRVPRASVLPDDATLRPSDMIEIVVSGEPELPRNFTVRADGSIRYPFLGVVRVQGSTARQVQTAIAKLIADKNLAANPSVTVTARGVR